jgi:hypothetical protein
LIGTIWFGGSIHGNKGIPNRVLDAMKDRVDVLSVRSISASRVRSQGRVWWGTWEAGLNGAAGS